MTKPLIDRICLRAQDDKGNWGSYTIRELWDLGRAEVAFVWLLSRISGFNLENGLSLEMLSALAEKLPPESYVALKDDEVQP